jgi:hypothetical protein
MDSKERFALDEGEKERRLQAIRARFAAATPTTRSAAKTSSPLLWGIVIALLAGSIMWFWA